MTAPRKGGAHRSPRRLLSQSPEAFAAQDEQAKREGKCWADWVRERLGAQLTKGPKS